MKLDIEPFGTTRDGDEVSRVEFDNGVLRGSLINYGARLVRLSVPDAAGRPADVVLGHDDLDSYERGPSYLGATCGRYGNRIRGGRITVDGVAHQLDTNEGHNQLHGGSRGFDRRVWSIEADEAEGAIRFSMESPDGDQGYPGRLMTSTTYSLEDATLRIRMEASTEVETVVNLVHHSYWNLAGHDRGSVSEHELMIDADSYTPVDDQLLPTGEVRSVDATPFDFRRPRRIGDDFDLDHNWVLGGAAGPVRRAAVLHDPSSGRTMTLETSEPGLQVYTGQHLRAEPLGKASTSYGRLSGLAMESQRWPDSPNLEHFPDAGLEAGEHYRHDYVATFSNS